MYFDEDLLLDIRLNSLNKFIKKFVITEATYTHNGSKKKLNFDIDKFKKKEDPKIDLIKKNSFQKCSYRNFSGGIVSIHSGWKL